MKKLLATLLASTILTAPALAQTYPGTLPANTVLGNPTGSPAPAGVVPLSGTSGKVGTVRGILTNGHCVSIASTGDLIDAGNSCGGGGGGNGTVNAGIVGQLAYYATSSNTVSGETLSGDATITAGGTLTISANTVTNTKLAQMAAGTVKCSSGSVTGNPSDCSKAQIGAAVVPDTFGVVDRTGTTDVGAIINSAIAATQSCLGTGAGNSVLHMSAGIYLITTPIVPKSCISLVGDGRGKTVFLTNSSAPFAQGSGSQLVHFNMSGITFKDSGSHAAATALSFTAIQGSRLENLGFIGYSSGTLMSIAGATVTSFDDTDFIFDNSNSIFNLFSDWVSDGCGDCIKEAGVYGTGATLSPPNSSNVPSIVVTQNRFDNFYVQNVGGKFIDVIKATDTEVYTHMVVFLNSNNGVAIQVGDDFANFPGNNYVNSIRAQISLSMSSPATAVTFARAGDWTFGNRFDFESDILPAALTGFTTQGSGVTQFNYDVCGKNYISTFLGSFNSNEVCISNAEYTRIGNGSSAVPIFGFLNDTTNGLYLPTAHEAAFSQALRIDGHIVTGALNTPTITSCGGTAAAFLGTPSDTAGQIVAGTATTTTCTLNFGAAYANVPYCTFQAVGQANTAFISSNSGSAITITYSTTSNQKWNYICMADPAG